MTEYLKKNHQSEMVETLQIILSNSFALYFKTHAYHWNVEGPHFDALHRLFGDQYTELWTALDDIAERMRQLGVYAPMNIGEMTKGSKFTEAKKHIDAISMVKDLAKDNEALSKLLADAIEKASELGDESSADLFVQRQQQHDKNAWMLNVTAK